MKRDINKARTIYTVSPQSSLYIPIIDPPTRIPSTVHFDPRSEWQTSALLSSAVESAMLPTRLRPYHDFEASLSGEDGTHKIFELQSRIVSEKDNNGSQTGKDESSEQPGSKVQKEFDLDFTYDERNSDQSHIYNQVQVWRGINNNASDESPEDPGLARRRQYHNSEPMCQR